MIFWIAAQLPPQLAAWLGQRFSVSVYALRDLGLRDAPDRQIFSAARDADAVLISKDMDFVDLVQRLGPPPRLLWVTCGNVMNTRLQQVFESTFVRAVGLLDEGRSVVEIGDAR